MSGRWVDVYLFENGLTVVEYLGFIIIVHLPDCQP